PHVPAEVLPPGRVRHPRRHVRAVVPVLARLRAGLPRRHRLHLEPEPGADGVPGVGLRPEPAGQARVTADGRPRRTAVQFEPGRRYGRQWSPFARRPKEARIWPASSPTAPTCPTTGSSVRRSPPSSGRAAARVRGPSPPTTR